MPARPPEPSVASLRDAPGEDESLALYWRFYWAVAAAQLSRWLPRSPSRILDLAGGTARSAAQAAAAGHRVIEVIDPYLGRHRSGVPLFAAERPNGTEANGARDKGAESNGAQSNGAPSTSAEPTGPEVNGAEVNGAEVNGPEVNGAARAEADGAAHAKGQGSPAGHGPPFPRTGENSPRTRETSPRTGENGPRTGENGRGPRSGATRPAPGQGLRVIADSGALGYLTDGCVDAVIAENRVLSRHLVTEAAVAEIARVLRPGGRVLLSVDSLTLGMALLAEQNCWAHLSDVPSAEVLLVPWPDGTITRCFWADQLRELLTDAGLEVDWIRPRTVLSPSTVEHVLASSPRALPRLVRTELNAPLNDDSLGVHLLASARRPG